MATDVNRLKSIRTAYKGHCTRNKKEANEIMSGGDNPDIEELDSRVFSKGCRYAWTR